jgi:hypothetical protein
MKSKIIIVLFLLILFLFSSCVIYQDIYFSKYLDEIIRNNPDIVTPIPIDTDYNASFSDFEAAIFIDFKDGGRIWVSNCNYRGRERGELGYQKMSIIDVDGYSLDFIYKNTKDAMSREGLELWSEIIGVRLEDLKDIIRNYDIIRKHVESWTNINDYKKEGERYWETRNRIIENGLYSSTVIFKGEEIILLKGRQ